MANPNRGRFSGQVASNARMTKTNSSYGYLRLPKGIRIFKEKPDTIVMLDIIPYIVTDPKHPDHNDETGAAIVGNMWYKRPIEVIRNIGPKKQRIISPISIGKSCPITDYRIKRMEQGAPKEETDKIKLSLRNLYWVIPRYSNEYPEELHLWDISQAMFQDQLTEELNQFEQFENFPDPDFGLTLQIRFAAKVIANGKPFAETSRIDFYERDRQYGEDFIRQNVPNMDEVPIIYSYEELYNMFYDLGDEPEAGDDDVQVPQDASAAMRPAAATMARPSPANAPTGPSRTGGSAPVVQPTAARPAAARPAAATGQPAAARPAAAQPANRPAAAVRPQPAMAARPAPANRPPMQPAHTADHPAPTPAEECVECVACGGTGTASNGSVCRPCGGKGILLSEPAPAPAAAASRQRKTAQPTAPAPAPEPDDPNMEGQDYVCPNGMTFGVDTDCDAGKDICPNCDFWDACFELQQASLEEQNG